MQRVAAKSPQAGSAYKLVVSLQQQLVNQLQQVIAVSDTGRKFEPIEWFRAGGRHGGGMRYIADDKAVFNQASVNVSQVQYDADDTKSLASATALSSIIHPHNPLAPSMHLHVSWTEMKTGHGYWRVMADLNPAIENAQHSQAFKAALEDAALNSEDSCLDHQQLATAFAQGDRYFNIPALGRHRGVCHFYLENYFTENTSADSSLAERIISRVIDTYADILAGTLSERNDLLGEDLSLQLNYHSLYFFQVLTLDRGTTSGLLVHDENDVGILGSLPTAVDKELIRSWKDKMPAPQGELLDALLDCLPDEEIAGSRRSVITESVKKALASAVRTHYKQYPKALALQASGEVIPPTVANHR